MAGIKREDLEAGICSDHGEVLVFWCIKCREWLCHDCSIVSHRSDTCAFLPWKRAVESFHTETEERVRRLDLKLTQSKSLVEKCQAWEAASLELLAIVQTLGKSLRERQESIETLLEEGSETLSRLKSQLETRVGKCLQLNTGSIHLCHKSQEFGPRANKALSDDGVTEKVSAAMGVMHRLDFTSYKAIEPSPPGVDEAVLATETLTPSSIGKLMAEDPKLKARGFLLEVTEGKLELPVIFHALGKENLEHLENVAKNLYIVTTVSTEIRNYIVSKIRSFSYPSAQSAAFTIHSITPFKVCVRGILFCTPSFISAKILPNIQKTISTTLPVLKNVTLEFDNWVGTGMYNGHLQMRCEADDLNELDRMLTTKGKYESSKRRIYEIPVGSDIRKLSCLGVTSLEKNILPKRFLKIPVKPWEW